MHACNSRNQKRPKWRSREASLGTVQLEHAPVYYGDGNALCFCCAPCASASRCFTNIKGLTCTMLLKNRCHYCPPLQSWELGYHRVQQLSCAFAWREELALSHLSAARGLGRAGGKVAFCRVLSVCSSSLHCIQVGLGRQTCSLRGTGGKIVINSSLIGIAVSNSA